MATRIGDVAMEDLAHTIVTGERAGYNTTKHL